MSKKITGGWFSFFSKSTNKDQPKSQERTYSEYFKSWLPSSAAKSSDTSNIQATGPEVKPKETATGSNMLGGKRKTKKAKKSKKSKTSKSKK